jgi:hypothetical protein
LGTKIAKFGKPSNQMTKVRTILNMMKNWGVKLAFAPKLRKQKLGS